MFLLNPFRFAVAAPFAVIASDFDGTNDDLKRGAGLTGATDTKTFVLSMWVRKDGGDGVTQRLFGTDGNAMIMNITGSNLIALDARSTGAVLSIRIDSGATTFLVGTDWKHILIAANMATTTVQMFLDDVDVVNVVTALDNTLDQTRSNWSVGGTTTGSFRTNGCITEVFFHNTFLDMSIVANRRKFIGADLKPVDLGSDGSTPLGVQPLIYLKQADAINSGSGGNFTVTGALAACSTSPSD